MNIRNIYKFCTNKYDYIYGINPVMAAIHSQKRQLDEIYINESQQNIDDYINPRISNIMDHANKINIPIKMVIKKQIEKLAGMGQPHQNVVLKCSPRKFLRVEDITEIKSNLIVFFDQITDPQNFGSIIRTAFFLGIDGFLVEEMNRCPLTPTISKVSSGALEMIDIHCSRQSQKILNIKDSNYCIIGTGINLKKDNYTINDNLQSLLKNVNIYWILFKKKKPIIVFGSESNGISQPILERCDFMINIPKGAQRIFPQTLVDSLNVGVSAGIILNHIIRQM